MKGGHLVNEAAPYLAEYTQRKRFAKLGYTTSISELSALKAEVFLLIDCEIEKIQSEDARKKNGK